jgi:hypothetical protein
VQGAPLLTLPAMLLLFPARHSHRRYLLVGLLFYAVAKLLEIYDRPVYIATADVVSGHTLKHLLAAAAPWMVLLMLMRREPVRG